MKILFDIVHPADINFFKNAIKILDDRGVNTVIIARDRGKIKDILKKELPHKTVLTIGKHQESLAGKAIGLIARSINISKFMHKKGFDVCTSFGFYVGTASYFSKTPSVLFADDREYALTYHLAKLSGNHFVLPTCIQASGKNIHNYDGFKELAYLHPNYFKPNVNELDKYGLEPYKYVFIRDVSKNSLNYRNLDVMDLPHILHKLNDLGLDAILSTEYKMNQLCDKCTILEGPVDDIFSLLSFALFTISSGDSMARESCLVGTPSIYTGGRDMVVNQEFIKRSCMFKVSNETELENTIIEIINNDIKTKTNKTIASALKNEWVDTTKTIVDVLMSATNKDEELIESMEQ